MNIESLSDVRNETLPTYEEDERIFLDEIKCSKAMPTSLENLDFVPSAYEKLFTPVFSSEERRERLHEVKLRIDGDSSEEEKKWLERAKIFLESHTR